jgi:tight adherence protein C
MSAAVLIPLLLLFASLAVMSGVVLNSAMARSAPGRRRLDRLGQAGEGGATAAGVVALTDAPSPAMERVRSYIPKSPQEMNRVQRRLANAGYRHPSAAIVFTLLEIAVPVLLVVAAIGRFGFSRGWLIAAFAGVIGYMLPGFVLAYKIEQRKKQIRNGLPDALDLMIVCVEAGSGMDQAIVRVSEELDLAYPALAEELRLITAETRAGKPRLEAFKNFARRTQVDDVRAFVAMLVQTDKFGTSIAQALRTHADTSRTKRRQRAEERAAKLTVKLIFPLVFCLFPAFYVVVLGPAVIRILRVFIQGQ